MKENIKKVIGKYHQPESTSFCHYVVKANQIYRDCYGKHVGFNMFSDNIMLSLSRKVHLPDMEFAMNLGDWPLVHKDSEPLPVFSWCGSNETIDIVLPTYDLTESTLENMGRYVMMIYVYIFLKGIQAETGAQVTVQHPSKKNISTNYLC